MKLPDNFALRILNGSDQRTYYARPTGKKGYVAIAKPINPEKLIGKVRIKPAPNARLTRTRHGRGISYQVRVLIGEKGLPGDIYWTDQPPSDHIDCDSFIEIVSVKAGVTPIKERAIEIELKRDYDDGEVYALRPHVAERLLKQLNATLYPEEGEE